MSESWHAQAMRRVRIADEIMRERNRQDEKFGEQWNTPLTEPGNAANCAALADAYKEVNDQHGNPFMATILLEEVYEALAESDPQTMRGELIQVAAVAMKMCEAIDREAGE